MNQMDFSACQQQQIYRIAPDISVLVYCMLTYYTQQQT